MTLSEHDSTVSWILIITGFVIPLTVYMYSTYSSDDGILITFSKTMASAAMVIGLVSTQYEDDDIKNRTYIVVVILLLVSILPILLKLFLYS